jgi:chromosome segregation ATPase
MLKKVVIAGLAVAVGVAVLAWLSPPLFEWICYNTKHAGQDIENSIPLEQRIDMLKDKLKDFDKEKVKYFDQVAHAEREVNDLDKDVAKSQKDLDLRWADIQARNDSLDKVSLKGKSLDEFKKKLSQDFDAYQIDEKTLDAKKDLLTARTKALEDGKAQLATLESRKAELQAKLTNMEEDLKVVRMKQAEKNLDLTSSNELTKWDAEANDLAGKIQDQKRSLELQDQYGNHSSDATPVTAAPESDIQKRIDDYKAARNGDAPKPVVADK